MSLVRGSRFVLATLVAVVGAPAQEWKRLVADLGHPERSEAAELALLALGDKAVQPLQHLLTELDATKAAGRDQLRAVARLVDLLGAAAGPLAGPLNEVAGANLKETTLDVLHALASLAPHSIAQAWHEHFHRLIHELPDPARAYPCFVRFANRSNAAVPTDFEAAKARLDADEVFVRELAAEAFATLRDPACLDLLRDRLLARDRQPNGYDGLRHNGFVVPMHDGFARRASDAMLSINPTDPRCAIAHAVRAVEHPYHAVRLQALRALASFGPDAAIAVPELMTLATGADATLAAEALKVLGVVGKAAAPHLATVCKLGERQDEVGRIARSLVARLRAMGVTLPPEKAAIADTASAEVAQAAAGLGAGDAAATAAAQHTLRAHRDLAFPALVARFRAERSEAPDAVVRLLAEFAAARGDADRNSLRYAIGTLTSDTWHGPMMSSSSGGGGERRPVHFEAYGRLRLGERTDLPQLVEGLADDDAMVRFAAARSLANQPTAVAAATATGEQTRTALLQALAAETPSKVSLESGPQQPQEVPMSFLPQLHAAIAIALVECTLPVETQRRLFDHALDADDPTVVAAAVRRYGGAATDAALAKAIADPRPAVAAAASEVQAARSSGK